MLQFIRDLIFPKAYDLSARTRPRPAAASAVPKPAAGAPHTSSAVGQQDARTR
jgi:hypothetical protein